MPFWKKSTPRDDHAETKPLRCSFCNKDQNEVAKLIAGPTVFICDECVEICVDIIADETRFRKPRFTKPLSGVPDTNATIEESAPADQATADDPTTDCPICRAPVLISDGLTIPGRGMLCADCEDAVVLAVENRWPADEGK